MIIAADISFNYVLMIIFRLFSWKSDPRNKDDIYKDPRPKMQPRCWENIHMYYKTTTLLHQWG